MSQATLRQNEDLAGQFHSVPKRQQTLEMCEAAIAKRGTDIQYVSDRLMSTELAIKAIEQDIEAFFLLKREQLNKETLKACIKKAKALGEAHYYASTIERKFNRFQNFKMNRLIDKDIALELVSWNGDLITSVPCRLRKDDDIMKTALTSNGNAITRLRNEDITEERVLVAIKGNLRVKNLPKSFMTEEVLIKMVEHDWEHIKDIPKECLTTEICMTALEQNESAVEYFNL